MIFFKASVRHATAATDDAITTSSVGIPVSLSLATEFTGLAKTVVFKAGSVTVDIALIGDADSTTVPPDVLTESGRYLSVGIYAADGNGTIVIPTVWAVVGLIQEGAVPSGVDPAAPTPSWVAQVQAIASEANETAATALETANDVAAQAQAGEFDGEPGPQGEPGDTPELYSVSYGYAYTYYSHTSPAPLPSRWYNTEGLAAAAYGGDIQGALLYTRITYTWKIGDTYYPNIRITQTLQGKQGEDGISPTVTVEEISGGHQVTITDETGPHTFDVMDGGAGTLDYDDLNNLPTLNGVEISGDKTSADYGLDDVFWATYRRTTNAEIEAAYQAGKVCLCEYDGYIFRLGRRVDATHHYFYAMTEATSRMLYVAPIGNAVVTWNYLYTYLSPPEAATATPSDLGTAAVGSSAKYAKEDHVHKMPTAVDVGAYVKPSGGIPASDLASAVQTSLGKADTALQSYTETDPTVPSWAKASSKPSYTKTEVGLGNVDNVQQYSASNPPPYPVSSVNGQTGVVVLTASDVGAGTYSKPSGGIPKTDLASDVQASLNKADEAISSSNTGTIGQVLTKTPSGQEWKNPSIATDAQIEAAVDEYLEDHPTVGGVFSNAAKHALLALLEKVAYIDEDGQSYLDTLEQELFAVAVASITAVYTQSGTVYDTDSLDSLRSDLVVTANYADGTSEIVTTYTLSGTLTAGSSSITVEYGGKTTLITVAVTHYDEIREVGYETNTWARTSISGQYLNYVFKKTVSTAARARSIAPIANHNYTFTVTDSAKYNIAVYGITSLETVNVSLGGGEGTRPCYPGVDNGVSWAASASRDTPYIAIALKKMDNTEFTAEELANGAVAVFTYTEGS